MPIERIFLDWRRPGLVAAVDYLVERYGAPGSLDLAGLVVAVPGARAKRRLVELLVERAAAEGWVLRPPELITVGHLPELLYLRKRPFADLFTQQLAWIRALEQFDQERLRLLVPAVPPADDLPGRLGLAAVLARLHRELAADGHDFAAVADCGAKVADFREERRWRTLAAVQDEYLCALDAVELWDVQTARLVAIKERECRAEKAIVLVGTVDLSRAQQLMLEQVADRVTALVLAPEELADRFDATGCLVADAWQDACLGIEDAQVEVVGAPADQAAAALATIASWDGRYAAEDITIGVPDESVVPYLQQQFEECGLRARHGAGTPLEQSAPYRLLTAAADYLDGERYAALAALVRHPAVADWLVGRKITGDWLTLLDEYYAGHFPEQLGGEWLGPSHEYQKLEELYREVRGLVKDLRGKARPMVEWSGPIADFLAKSFGAKTLDTTRPGDRQVLAACEAIHGVLQGIGAIQPVLMPSMSGAEALRQVTRLAAAERLPPLAERGAIELLGWLELAMDDAPALVITGMNEGTIPSSLNADMFLPNQLRRCLGIEDNQRRYARDAYALSAIAASRAELKLIAGRRGAEGDPLVPSRLFFACAEERAARRAMAFFAEKEETRRAPLAGSLRPAAQSKLKPPLPRPLAEQVTSMRVTEFRDYLACPYRYYLRHRLRLKAVSDGAEEINELGFGSLAHEVLCGFGKGDLTTSTDAAAIEAQLCDLLFSRLRRDYGTKPLPVVRIQAEQLRARLAAFARWQAKWAAEGWRIHAAECEPKEGATLDVDGESMVLRGRIDRIDVNDRGNVKYVIFDYKTSGKAKRPEETHLDGEKWIDLQLPLYRRLAQALGIEGPFQYGYIAIPKNTTRVGDLLAAWDDKVIDQAEKIAEDVIRGVRAQVFTGPTNPPPAFFDELAAICHEGQYAAALLAGEGEDDDG